MKPVRFKPLFLEARSGERLCWTVRDLQDANWRPKTETGRVQRFASEDAATDHADQHNRAHGARTLRLSASVDRIVSTAREGERLVRSYRNRRGLDPETVYHFEPSGESAPPKVAEEAIEMELLAPLADGLFGDLTAQTFVYRKAEAAQ